MTIETILLVPLERFSPDTEKDIGFNYIVKKSETN